MNWFLYQNILIPIFVALIVNYLIFSYGWNKVYKKKQVNPLLPPGYIVGLIWMILFGILGYVHYRLYKLNNKSNIATIYIILFIIFCLAYPFLTNGLEEKKVLLLNLITLILAFILSLIVITYSRDIFYYLIPLLLWATYVNIIYS